MQYHNSNEKMAHTQAVFINGLLRPRSEPSFQSINPFGDALADSYMDGAHWRLKCPRCNGKGYLNTEWAAPNQYANMGNNCFLCTKVGKASGHHALAPIHQFTQVLLQTSFLLAHQHEWSADSYGPVLLRFLTVRSSKVKGPYQESLFRIYGALKDRVERFSSDWSATQLLDVLENTPTVRAACTWYNASVGENVLYFDAANSTQEDINE